MYSVADKKKVGDRKKERKKQKDKKELKLVRTKPCRIADSRSTGPLFKCFNLDYQREAERSIVGITKIQARKSRNRTAKSQRSIELTRPRLAQILSSVRLHPFYSFPSFIFLALSLSFSGFHTHSLFLYQQPSSKRSRSFRCFK